MLRLIKFLAILIIGAGAGWAAREIMGPQPWSKWINDIAKQAGGDSVSNDDAIKIASWNLEVTQEKMASPDVVSRIAETLRQFDVVAVQGVRSAQQDVLPRLVAAANAEGAQYDFVLGPRLGHAGDQAQFAFVYNTERIEIDHARVFTVADPGDRLVREPLAGLFRVRGPEPTEAFTFMLVNAHVDPNWTSEELAALADVYRAVRNSGLGEDDVIILGDFNAAPDALDELKQLPQVNWVASGAPTTVRQTAELDNILFHGAATREFTGRGGVLNLEAQLKLTREQALAICEHLPVWAEFSVIEGGRIGYVAGNTPTTR